MDNRHRGVEYEAFLLELIQLINRDNSINRQPRVNRQHNHETRNTFHQQQNTRYQSAESTYRQQICDIISHYNTNVHEYQQNMREYNDIIMYSLEMLQALRPNRNVNPPYSNQNTRNYLSTSAGWRGLFNNNRTTPFANIFAEPVIVRPTNDQITNATRMIQYSSDLSNNTRCPITLEEFQASELVCEIKHCRHLFKRDSIMDWFQRNVRCPVCRYDIRDYVAEQEEVPETDEPFEDASPFLIDLSNNLSRTSSPLRRHASPILNTALANSVNTQINSIATNISNILHNYIEQETTETNEIPSNVFTFEIPIIYFDLSSGAHESLDVTREPNL
jgi:hypothetical protein